jgi:hypothetical protein
LGGWVVVEGMFVVGGWVELDELLVWEIILHNYNYTTLLQ